MRKVILFLSLFIMSLYAGQIDFSLVKSFNINGNYELIGNTVLEVDKNLNIPPDECFQSLDGYMGCGVKDGTVMYHGDGYPVGHTNINNWNFLKYVNVSDDQNLYDSSESNLTLPVGSKIIFARLYWTGMVFNTDNDIVVSKQVYLKINNGQFIPLEVTGSRFSQTEGYTYIYHDYPYFIRYVAYKDVTDLFKNIDFSKKNSIAVTVGNVACLQGWENGLGNYGAWSLLVVYKNKGLHFKNISIYGGYKQVHSGQNISFTVSNFITPLYGAVKSQISVFASEGDKGLTGDSMLVNNKYVTKNKTYPNAYDNIFDSTITNGEYRNPDIANNMGIDIDTFPIGQDGDTTHPQIIKNGETEAKIKCTTNQDNYLVNVIVFSTDLYVPKVCYDDLQFYTKNGLVQPGEQIPVGSNIKMVFNVKNMDNKTAKDVYISYTFDNNFSYVPNSTFVQNVPYDKNPLVHINDNSSSPYDDNLKVYYDKNTQEWKVGIIGDSNKQFLPTIIYPKYKATVELNATVKSEGNFSFNFLTSYKYTIGTKTYSYTNEYLPKCSSFNTYLSAYSPDIGSFNVVEPTFNQTTDPKSGSVNNIYTKIVNKPFDMKILHLGKDYETLKNYKGTVYLQVISITDANTSYDCQTKPAIWNKKLYFNKQSSFLVKDIVIPRAIKNAAFRIVYTHKKKTYKVCSRDNFAVRPYKFVIVNYPKTPVKAGGDFNLTIKAVGYKGKAAADYNETVHIKGNSPDLDDKDLKNNCITKLLEKANTNVNLVFINGEANLSLKYPEVGDLNVTIKEIKGSEYAFVDEKQDTSNDQLFISPASQIISFIPYQFKVSGTYSNYNGQKFTYLSNDLNMSSKLDLTITAVNAQGVTTKNYTDQCYAQNLDINITHSALPNYVNTILYKEKDLSKQSVSASSMITFNNVFKQDFNATNPGIAKLTIFVNFPKKYDTPLLPFNFSLKDINVTDSNGTFGSSTINVPVTVNFRYGRILMKDVNSLPNSKSVNTTFKYEYWTANGWVLNKDHVRADGDINLSQVIVAANGVKPLSNSDISVQVIPQSGKYILNGVENVQISTTHALPYSAKLHFGIPSWLWYYPLATKYEAPSLKNLNCLTHPCMKVTFISNGQGWAGIGSASSKYSESNMTVKVKMKSDVNATKGQVKKINW